MGRKVGFLIFFVTNNRSEERNAPPPIGGLGNPQQRVSPREPTATLYDSGPKDNFSRDTYLSSPSLAYANLGTFNGALDGIEIAIYDGSSGSLFQHLDLVSGHFKGFWWKDADGIKRYYIKFDKISKKWQNVGKVGWCGYMIRLEATCEYMDLKKKGQVREPMSDWMRRVGIPRANERWFKPNGEYRENPWRYEIPQWIREQAIVIGKNGFDILGFCYWNFDSVRVHKKRYGFQNYEGRFYCASNNGIVKTIEKHLKKYGPDAPIIVTGMSSGACDVAKIDSILYERTGRRANLLYMADPRNMLLPSFKNITQPSDISRGEQYCYLTSVAKPSEVSSMSFGKQLVSTPKDNQRSYARNKPSDPPNLPSRAYAFAERKVDSANSRKTNVSHEALQYTLNEGYQNTLNMNQIYDGLLFQPMKAQPDVASANTGEALRYIMNKPQGTGFAAARSKSHNPTGNIWSIADDSPYLQIAAADLNDLFDMNFSQNYSFLPSLESFSEPSSMRVAMDYSRFLPKISWLA